MYVRGKRDDGELQSLCVVVLSHPMRQWNLRSASALSTYHDQAAESLKADSSFGDSHPRHNKGDFGVVACSKDNAHHHACQQTASQQQKKIKKGQKEDQKNEHIYNSRPYVLLTKGIKLSKVL